VALAPLVLAVRATAPLAPRSLEDVLSVRMTFDKSIEKQDLIVVNPPVVGLLGTCLFTFEHDGVPSPRAIRALAPGNLPMTVKRTDDRTLEVEPDAGYLKLFVDQLFRDEQHPLHLGEQVHLS
jgi:hypothetical protein